MRDPESETSRPVSLSSKTEDAQPTASGLARSGTLSWQQRRDGPRQRPLSGFATVRSISREPEEDSSKADLTRTEIAASLASKDPTWFRQTQDRGVGSAAFRKSQVEEAPEPLAPKSMQLPGMTRSREPSKSPAPESKDEPKSTPQKPASNMNSSPRFARGTTPDIAALRESMAEKPPSLRPSSQDTFSSRPTSTDTLGLDDSTTTLARSSSSLAYNRPSSPTKGLGGFVESAMMKRSDSVNKRWSVKSNTGLVRGDSVAGARPRSLHNRGMSRDVPATRGDTPSSPLASSRPGSSYGQPANTAPPQVPEKPKTDATQEIERAQPQIQTAPINQRPQTPPEDATLAQSPSKTMDPRRWSPTKSTWLETALQQQTEPPKLLPLKEEQPKWKIDLQRSKSRASRDVSPEKSATLLQTSDQSSKIDIPTQPKVVSPPIQQNAFAKAPVSTAVPEPSTPKQPVEPQKTESDVPVKPTAKPEVAKKVDMEQIPEPTQSSVQKDIPVVPKQGPVLKPKPQTPPKTDFRATLKSRTAGPTQTADSEPEFRSMFGKLKRTTTQNYVAPDELKTNILTGKAALSVTGGPVKAKRVDEFKESILAKKEEIKTTAPKPTSNIESKSKDEDPLPEALARRKTLSKASAPDLSSLRKKPDTKPDLPAKLVSTKSTDLVAKSIEATPALAVKAEMSSKPFSTKRSINVQDNKPSPKMVDEVKISLSSSRMQSETASPIFKTKSLPAVSSSVEDSPLTRAKSPEMSRQSNTFPVVEPAKSSSMTTPPVASKLASRLNPNLAAILSRGPSPKPPAASREENDDTEEVTVQNSTSRGTSNDDTGLTHMTKGRAKGPKRRAPKAEAKAEPKVQPKAELKTETQPEVKAETRVEPRVEVRSSVKPDPQPKPAQAPEQSAVPAVKTINIGRSLPQTPKPDSTPTKPARVSKPIPSILDVSRDQELAALKELQQPKMPLKPSEPADIAIEKKNTVQNEQQIPASIEKPRPVIAGKSPELRRVSGTPTATRLSSDSKPATPPKPVLGFTTPKAKTVSEQEEVPVPKPSKVEMPTISATGSASGTNMRPISLKPKPPVIKGLGLQLSPSPQAVKPPVKPRELTPPPEAEIKIPKTRQNGNVKSLLEGYVGVFPKDNEKADFDSQQLLKSVAQDQAKIKTLQHSIVEVSGDGKRSELPSHQQPVLFEEAMYLTTHKFSLDNGATVSEVQLWCGDRVSDAAIDDAQIFCRRTAREHSVKLEVVKQGKESSNFIAGLGGILITRRTKSSALYMLCGRQHLSHIVFDEVDMTRQNLCSGFVYLISAPYGKLFLWKGKGAGVNETSSAKLIGTDLGLTGEIEEIEQGKESSSFWEAVGKSEPSQYSKDWDSKASRKGHQTVLYRVDHERPGMLTNLASWGLKRAASPSKQQIKATCEPMQPFTQNDLDHPSIHILDAYHSLYIIITRQCASKAAEFITSMHLAQDFAMLSPAIQDRPLLPTCYVVAGELPQDVKICFRKWSNIEANSLLGQGSLCVRLEEVMEAVGL